VRQIYYTFIWYLNKVRTRGYGKPGQRVFYEREKAHSVGVPLIKYSFF